MASLGLDLTRNLSYYTIPACFVACLAPHLLAVTSAGKVFDNANPRGFDEAADKSAALDKDTKGRIARAQAASANGFETIGLYAAAVVAANHAGVDTETLNRLTIGYVVSRFAYVFTYVNLGANPKTAYVRTAVWFVGVSSILTLFIKAGQKLNV